MCINFGAYLDAIADKLMINVSFFILYKIDILPLYVFLVVFMERFYNIIRNNIE